MVARQTNYFLQRKPALRRIRNVCLSCRTQTKSGSRFQMRLAATSISLLLLFSRRWISDAFAEHTAEESKMGKNQMGTDPAPIRIQYQPAI